MAANTNPQAVAFCNNVARQLFDRMMQVYNFAKSTQGVWTAQGLPAIILNTSDLIADGSALDGRPPITGANVNILIANSTTLTNVFEASTNLILNQTLVGAVNPNAGLFNA